ncbi:MAG TPA: PIG-L family deacetylase [Chryseosolibacter sp.]
MKIPKLTLVLTLLMLAAAFACESVEDVRQYAAIETYPTDTVLAMVPVKKALIVIAHDDDMCAIAGTASLLNKSNWEVGVLSLYRTSERNAAHIEACRNILDTVMFVDLKPEQIRNDREENRKGYYAVPRDSLNIIFNRQLMEDEYLRKIREFHPSVIFTLDNEMGGYGHPEHVLVSQIVVDLAAEKQIQPFYIYQSVYTDHMENSIMKRHAARMKSWGFPGDEWDQAKQIYGVKGMPEPTVQINIQSAAKEKMAYLRSYEERERKTLGFFIPEFEKYDAEEYFQIFDREFFRVIKN